jgi:hypothetical protein
MIDQYGIPVDIDVGISKLVKLIWDHDLITDGSCEEIEPGWFWIKFPDIAFGRAFIAKIARCIHDKYQNVDTQHYEDCLSMRAHGFQCIDSLSPTWRIMFPFYGGISFWIPKQDQARLESLLSS